MICASRRAALWAAGEATLDTRQVYASLSLAPNAYGLVAMFLSGGKSRRSPVQQAIAASLRKQGVATCVAELLDPDEAEDQRIMKDSALLAGRIHATLDILACRSDTRRLPLVLLSADATVPAAVAVVAARAQQVLAMVACYGRPDLSLVNVAELHVPTLLVVPGKEKLLVERNEIVFERLNCPSQLAVIVGASREFSEPGTLVACDYVVQQWCERHLRSVGESRRGGQWRVAGGERY